MLSIFQKYMEFFPFIIIMCSISFGMFYIIFKRNNLVMFLNSFLGIFLTIYYLLFFKDKLLHKINFFFHFDKFSIFFSLLILIIMLITSIFAYFCLDKKKLYIEEYYILLLLFLLGSISLSFSKQVSLFFISIEIITLSTIGLVYFFNDNKKSIEASLKYMIFSSFSSIFMLFGIGIIYFITGSLKYENLYLIINKFDIYKQTAVFLGISIILFSIFFKMSLFPFHFVFPDIYQVSSPLYLMCFSTVNKLSFFSFLIYFFSSTLILKINFFYNLVQIFSLLSILIGNLLALFQNNVKRLLGYASISQVGYLMISVLSLNKFEFSIQNIFFYFLNYVICNICIFGTFAILKSGYIYREIDNNFFKKNIFSNMFHTYPLLSISLFIVFFSTAGIPPTVGFLNKLYILSYAIHNNFWILMFCIIFSSIFGTYLYFKIIVSFYNEIKDIKMNRHRFFFIENILEIFIFIMSTTLLLYNFLFYNFFNKVLFL
ncbi:NADH-quinone oxidoreductase subunit N [Buchnera aphidicola (Pseudoregma panicola)]|uniref:NADH-quinone oxidoreductase subunit N n=1 Tax=Buchnera aphidicola TaxID=9 RepID=UPI0031B6FFEB